jgi:hypothetical protein
MCSTISKVGENPPQECAMRLIVSTTFDGMKLHVCPRLVLIKKQYFRRTSTRRPPFC